MGKYIKKLLEKLLTVITNDSLQALGLRKGGLATAGVKAPWVILHKGEEEPACSAENRGQGIITHQTRGRISTEYVVRLADGTELCSIVTATGGRRLDLQEGDMVWAFFNCFSVVLHVG